jgi:integrase
MQTKLELSRTGRWEVRYSEKLPNGTYRSRSISTRQTDRSEAERWQKAFEVELLQAATRAEGALFGDLIQAYMQRDKFRRRPGSDKLIYFLKQLDRGIGSLSVKELTEPVLADYIERQGWAQGTARRAISTIRAVQAYAVKARLVKAEDVPYVERPPAAPPRDKWLNEDEEAQLYALALGFSMGRDRLNRVTLFTCIALDTGQRKNAILNLTWSKVDFESGIIDFRLGKVAANKRQGIVPISRRLRPLLERAYRERESDFVLFTNREIHAQYDAFVASRGFEGMNPHSLRHTWATLNLRAGSTIWEVAGVLGNSPQLVASTYGHHSPSHLRGVIDRRFES